MIQRLYRLLSTWAILCALDDEIALTYSTDAEEMKAKLEEAGAKVTLK
jgi:hypothetical protein